MFALALTILGLIVPPASSEVFQGAGYHFEHPGRGYKLTKKAVEGVEVVLLHGKDTATKGLADAEPAAVAKKNAIRVEAAGADAGELAEIREATESDLKEQGIKYTVTEVNVLSMPGIYFRTSDFGQFILKGKSKTFVVTSNPNDKTVVNLVKTLKEGAPGDAPAVQPMARKKLGGSAGSAAQGPAMTSSQKSKLQQHATRKKAEIVFRAKGYNGPELKLEPDTVPGNPKPKK